MVIPQKMYAGMDVFVLLSIPGFILAGNLMRRFGMPPKLSSVVMFYDDWLKAIFF